MSDREDPEITLKREGTVKQLLRRAAKGARPSQLCSSIVPHGQETDVNREFASRREANGLVWFFSIPPRICDRLGDLCENGRDLKNSSAGRDRGKGKEMSASALETMKEQADELEARTLALPPQPGRDELLRDLVEFRAKLARENEKAAALQQRPSGGS